MSVLFYLDESGDSGWSLDLPYGHGGSTRHLTIATISCTTASNKYIGRFIKSLKADFGYTRKQEMKWINLTHDQRIIFSAKAKALIENRDGIKFHAVILAKRGVHAHLRGDKALLYNYMIKHSLINDIVEHDKITLMPDPQGISPKSGAPLEHYIRHAAFEVAVDRCEEPTKIGFKEEDSAKSLGIQFADFLAGAIQIYYEGGPSDYFNNLNDHTDIKELFFERAELQAEPIVEVLN